MMLLFNKLCVPQTLCFSLYHYENDRITSITAIETDVFSCKKKNDRKTMQTAVILPIPL